MHTESDRPYGSRGPADVPRFLRAPAPDAEPADADRTKPEQGAGARGDDPEFDDFWSPPSLGPQPVPEPLPGKSSWRSIGAWAALAGIIAAVAFLAAKIFDFSATGDLTKVTTTVAVATPPAGPATGPQSAATERDRHPRPALVAPQPPARAAGDPAGLGVSVRDADEGTSLIVRGLAEGARLSAGAPTRDGWRLAAGELDNAVIEPPRGFVGPMDIKLELHAADGLVSDNGTLHFEWTTAAGPRPGPTAPTIRALDPAEIAALLERGNALIVSGDLGAARLVLQRAAEAGDARAAYTLATTYDPSVLQRLAVHGFAPDLALARLWYERAAKFGSPEAPRRLEMLASHQE